jgi:hypothetical protein
MTGRRALKENLHQVNNNTRSDRIALFTCGSPLSTLYQTFFSRYFDCVFFARTSSMRFKLLRSYGRAAAWWRCWAR